MKNTLFFLMLTCLLSNSCFASVKICAQTIEKLLSDRVVYTNDLEDFENGIYLVSVELQTDAYGGRQVGVIVENGEQTVLKEPNLDVDKHWKYYEFIFEKNSDLAEGKLIVDLQYSSAVKLRDLKIEKI